MHSSARCSLALRTSTLFLLCLTHTASAATGRGSVSLWSDSSCGDDFTLAFSEPRIIDLNYTLPADTCHNLARSAHSYSVTKRPICNDGREADFSYYSSRDCPEDETRSLSTTNVDGYSLDGLCLALVTFDSVAFVCEGVGSGDSNSNSDSTTQSSPVVTSRSDLVVGPTPTATPVAPGSSLTAPLYTVLDTSAYTLAPTGTVGPSSGQPSPTGGFPPSPSPFTGVAAGRGVSLLGVFVWVVVGVLL
ncbi:MAG: hypothetical protein LQ343_004112 [Gyalolechia ehrenbergii]|nr:MAG: hypothetical protein LQ343_004112 [Gyalolechia ehrenbergii]